MKKLLPILLLLVVAGGVWYLGPWNSSSFPLTVGGGSSGMAPSDNGNGAGSSSGSASQDIGSGTSGATGGTSSASGITLEPQEGDLEPIDDRGASEVYSSAEQALDAIKRGAATYDDVVLQQFTTPGEDCTWCDSVYSSLQDLLRSPTTSSDQKSYYAELLAISGRPGNISSLVEMIKNAPNAEEADVLAEALELTVGNDDVVKVLATEMESSSETLKEAAVAAITNQGSRFAIETLYQKTVQKGDPDGFYSQGLGVGETVPDEAAYPFLQEQLNKRDQFSHLAAKSLLNAGLPGLKLVVESLTNSRQGELDKQLLKDAADHVAYDEDTASFLRDVAKSSKDQALVEFASQVLEEFKKSEDEAAE